MIFTQVTAQIRGMSARAVHWLTALIVSTKVKAACTRTTSGVTAGSKRFPFCNLNGCNLRARILLLHMPGFHCQHPILWGDLSMKCPKLNYLV